MVAVTGGTTGSVGAAGLVEGDPRWVDVTLPDLEAGKRFYGGLFGWTFGAAAPAGHRGAVEALSHGKRVAGLVPLRDGRMPTAWTVYFATPDAMATTARIRAAGGRPVMQPQWIDGHGVMATAVDPSGAWFGLWQPADYPGFEARVDAGSFLWTEVYTRDPVAVDRFYAEVFDYGIGGVTADGSEAERPDFVLWSLPGDPVDEEHAVGGRVTFDASSPVEMPAHYLTYFAVTDCDEAARVAVRLGGRVSHGPRTTPLGRYAGLVDDQGAAFAVIDVETVAEP